MLFLVYLNLEFSRSLLKEVKTTLALSAKKKAIIAVFRYDSKVLTATRTAGAPAVCKVGPSACIPTAFFLLSNFPSRFSNSIDTREMFSTS